MKLLFWRRDPIPVLELHGLIATRAGALNIQAIGPLIARAIATAGRGGTLIVDIESPGGSPVQSDLIAGRIRRLADKEGVKVRTVIGEVGASGGYWLACAGDHITAHPMSIVGSIGVIGGGFGFPEALARLGVERRIYKAGENKARLDPFSAERPADITFVAGLMENLHTRFKDWVRSRRAGKLTADEAAIFDGGYMLGEQALALGLVDGLGDLDSVLREVGGANARARVFRPRRRRFLGRLTRMAARGVVEAGLDVLEERAAQPSLRISLGS